MNYNYPIFHNKLNIVQRVRSTTNKKKNQYPVTLVDLGDSVVCGIVQIVHSKKKDNLNCSHFTTNKETQ